MLRDDEMIQQLIAERQRIDNLINSYKKDCEELTSTNNQVETSPKEYSFGEMVNQALESNGALCSTREATSQYDIKVVRYNPTINITIDNSYHTSTNHESHVNTTLAGGDKVIDTLGSILRNLFD